MAIVAVTCDVCSGSIDLLEVQIERGDDERPVIILPPRSVVLLEKPGEPNLVLCHECAKEVADQVF
jgi:hypothetical protein